MAEIPFRFIFLLYGYDLVFFYYVQAKGVIVLSKRSFAKYMLGELALH